MAKSLTYILVALWMAVVLDTAAQVDTSRTFVKPLKGVKHLRVNYGYPNYKGYYFHGQVNAGLFQTGAKVTGGYRFNQFAMAGLSFGADWVAGGVQSNYDEEPYTGVYFPICVHFMGDILKRRITPYYSAEAGYAFRYSRDYDYINVSQHGISKPTYHNDGGFVGEVGFGAKFYTRHHPMYITLSADLDIKQGIDKYSNSFINSIGQDVKVAYSANSFLLIPGIKVGIGFYR